MANTAYKITQSVDKGGDNISNTFTVNCSSAEISNFLAELEGEYDVWVKDDNLSGGSSTALTSYNGIAQIVFKGKDTNKNFLYNRIKPFRGLIYCKNTTTSDVIQGIFANANPFPSFPTIKADDIVSTIGESNGATATTP